MKLQQLQEARIANRANLRNGYVVVVRNPDELEIIEKIYGPFNTEDQALEFLDMAYGQIGVNPENESHIDPNTIDVYPVGHPNSL